MKRRAKGTLPIFGLLKEDHRRSLELLSILTAPKAYARRGLNFLELQKELEMNALAEEQTLYPKLAEKEEAQGLVRQARQRHSTIRFYLEKLENLAIENPAFLTMAGTLKDFVERHVYEEENEVFNKMQETLSEEELVQVACDFKGVKENLLAPSIAA